MERGDISNFENRVFDWRNPHVYELRDLEKEQFIINHDKE